MISAPAERLPQALRPAPPLLRALATLSRLLPPVRGAGWLWWHLIRPLWLAQNDRQSYVMQIWPHVRMLVNPCDYVGGLLAFLPQTYDRWERKAIKRLLRPGGTFVDVGSNVGAYALWAACCAGPAGRVVAIEADPENFDDLVNNISLNARTEIVQACQVGVADASSVLDFYRAPTGNRGALISPAGAGWQAAYDAKPSVQFSSRAAYPKWT